MLLPKNEYQSISQKAVLLYLKYDVGSIIDGHLLSSIWDVWRYLNPKEVEAIANPTFKAFSGLGYRIKKSV